MVGCLYDLVHRVIHNMVSAFDSRIIKVTIEFDDGISTFEGLNIRANGEKYMSALPGNCQCAIYNLTKSQRNYILTRTSPLNKDRSDIRMTIEVGRQSYGTFILFDGSIWRAAMTQPPDIGLILEAYTYGYSATQTVSKTYAPYSQLSQIAQSIANDLGMVLINHATDKIVGNVSHSGSVAQQVQQLNNIGGVIAYSSNNILYVVDAGKALPGASRIINSSTGMIGIPQITDYGCSTSVMMDNTINLGGSVTIQSMENPAANGIYYVEKIDFDVANREDPFWQILSCKGINYYAGVQ
jgi:hypothetical protein